MSGAWIDLVRESGHWVDRWRAYKVMVDGEPRATIRPGTSITLEVYPGHHAVEVVSTGVVADRSRWTWTRVNTSP